MHKKTAWGILGLGKIAGTFASDLALVENARLHAVASRDSEIAADFARVHGSQRAYGSY